MALTPEQIERKEFMVELRGYDKSQVHAFLREVAAEFRNALEGDTPGSGADPSAIDGFAARLSEVLSAASDEVAGIIAAANREAAQIRADALAEANKIRDEARAESPNDSRPPPQGILDQLTKSPWTRRGRT